MFRPLNIIVSKFLNSSVYRILLAFIAALLLSSSLSCFGYYNFAWISLVPLILLNKSAKTFSTLILESLIFFFIYNLISFIWIFSIHPLNWLGLKSIESGVIANLAWLIPSLYQSCFLLIFPIAIWLIYQFKSKKKLEELSVIEIIILAFIWALIQYKIFANGNNPLSIFAIPINQLAYSQASNADIKELLAIIGSPGLEILIVCFNILIANLIHVYNFSNSQAKMFYTNQASHGMIEINSLAKNLFNLALLIVLFTGIKLSNFNQSKLEAINPISIRLIQANLDRKDTRADLNNLMNIINKQKLLSLKGLSESKSDLLIWSEAGIPSSDGTELTTSLLSSLAEHYESFLYGTYREDGLSTFNSLSLINFEQGLEQNYNKEFLVPFGEYTPLINLFPTPIKRLAHNTIGSGFDAMKSKQKLLKLKQEKIRFASSICFELLFPKLTKEQVSKGAQFIVNINDLSWFSNTIINDLFLAVAKVRALEHKKELILSSNSGYSSLISAEGEIVKLSPLNKEAHLDFMLSPNNCKTFYSRYGW